MKLINQILGFDTSKLSIKNYNNDPLKTFVKLDYHNTHYGPKQKTKN